MSAEPPTLEELAFNGIDGATGEYLLAGLRVEDLSKVARGESPDPDHLAELVDRANPSAPPSFGVKHGIDQDDLAQTGWGVIFAHADRDRVEALKEALGPLLELRRQQTGELYREYVGRDAYRPGESKAKFLARHGVGPGPADPDKMPYYLLLVGSPEDIPYRFQYQLDVQYAVGRLHFDELDDYAAYARAVKAAESGEVRRSREVALFGVRNPGDLATRLSTDELVKPLARELIAEVEDWKIREVVEEEATKSNLKGIFAEESGPALLFTASHGMGFPRGHDRQISHQGALLCQDWPGAREWGRKAIPPEHYFAADDLAEDCHPAGLVSFHFACYGAGTPLYDDFAHQAFKKRVDIADRAFIAKMPQRLLSHPSGGALAAVGHVERAWGCSFVWPRAGRQITVFESALQALMSGSPVGAAMEYFNSRYAELASDLSSEIEEVEFGKSPDHRELAGMWTAQNDARSYVVLGDPAVRLAV